MTPAEHSPPSPPPATCRVTYRMTDQMGVVYYGHYLELFEMGRMQWLRSGGLDYRRMEAEGYMLIVQRAECDYLAPARFDDLLEIATRVPQISRARIEFDYEIRRQGEDRLLARGMTRHVVVSPEGRPRRLAPEWFDRLRPLAQIDPEVAPS